MKRLANEVQRQYIFLNNLFKRIWKLWCEINVVLRVTFKNFKWKNKKAKPGVAYQPTQIEQIANIITHGIWIIPAGICTNKLLSRSHTSNQLRVSWIYGGALTMLFIISTIFHCSCYSKKQSYFKNILHRCDRAMIYIFIAGSYFPWFQLQRSARSTFILYMELEWIIWVMAAIGITYQQIFHERYKCLETCFYILMGFGPAILAILDGHDFQGLSELKIGGLFYIIGVYFFKSDGIIPLAHAIWHIFVVLASTLHYYAILNYLYPINREVYNLTQS